MGEARKMCRGVVRWSCVLRCQNCIFLSLDPAVILGCPPSMLCSAGQPLLDVSQNLSLHGCLGKACGFQCS